MKYALLLPVIFTMSAGSAYASALHDGMRPESDAAPFSVQSPLGSFEALGSTGHIATARHRVEFVHADSDSSVLRSGMRPE
jgi:hypothetical protein